MRGAILLALHAILGVVAPASAYVRNEDNGAGADDSPVDKLALKRKVLDMFHHAYGSYMKYAFPADELMPLSCDGRVRGVTPSRGDVDDALGGFSLTLIDSADTLAVLGLYEEFDRACGLIVDNVKFDNDLVVSVFETNIRILGGLLSAHVLALRVKAAVPERFNWYSDQLLRMADDIGTRLLPAFNTTSGIPFARINLKHGMTPHLSQQQDTCTACAGTAILEFAALSRLSGKPQFEKAARKAMDFLWESRHRYSDLMGTVLNIHNGDWVRKDAGVGAGIDSYYEYCLKAYILLGDVAYLHRFNKHYAAVMKYINRGPALIDVHMHRPTVASRPFMDALSAFWPGLQVLKGDLKPAIETHEMLTQIIEKHKFLPEAFTHDFQVHWAEHWLRPEFIESTYFLYKATRDPHYLKVAEKVMDSMERHGRVRCGYAGIRDIRTMQHEDRMDSFLLAETFKYLYMLFAERDDLLFDVDDFVFTTEAHMLPMTLAHQSVLPEVPMSLYDRDFYNDGYNSIRGTDDQNLSAGIKLRQSLADRHSCPNPVHRFNAELVAWGRRLRRRLTNLVNLASTVGQGDPYQCPSQGARGPPPPSHSTMDTSAPLPVSAADFRPDNPQQLAALAKLGVIVTPAEEGGNAVHVAHSPVMNSRRGPGSKRRAGGAQSFGGWVSSELLAGDALAMAFVLFAAWLATMLVGAVCVCGVAVGARLSVRLVRRIRGR